MTSLVMFVLVKPFAYFAFIQAFRFRVSRAIPMTRRQAVKLAGLRTLLGLTFVGGGTVFFFWVAMPQTGLLAFVFLYASRLAAWWFTGAVGAHLKGHRLLSWVLCGTLINVAFDLGAVCGIVEGWYFPAATIVAIAVFIAILDAIGSRDSLKLRFDSEPHCRKCQYNLTGNISGICPECGSPVRAFGLADPHTARQT